MAVACAKSAVCQLMRVAWRTVGAIVAPARCARITHVSADAADWVGKAVAEHCPNAVRCADPFHVVAWPPPPWTRNTAGARNTASGRRSTRCGDATRNQGALGQARALKRARWCLWKNPENLTPHQQAKLAWIARTSPRLHRAYLLK